MRLDPEIGERAEGLGRDAGMALHACSYDADLAEPFALGPARAEPLERAGGRVAVLLRRGEDDAGSDLDHGVDVHRRVRERLEELGRICALDLEHRLLDVVGDACDHRLLEHPLVLLAYPGALVVRERRAHVQRNAVVARELDAAQLEHLRAGRRQLEHLLVADRVELARPGNDARVGGEDALDVGVDLAALGAECGGERDGGRVRAAAAERGHVVVGGDALEAGDEDDLVPVERLVDAARADVHDLRLAVLRVGDDPGLRAGQRDGTVAEVIR